MTRRTATVVALVVAAPLLASTPASAADAVAEARADYDAAAAAYDRRDYGTAAARFARADELVPNARTLQLAMAAALLASDAPLAMNLADRSEARPRSPALEELARKIRAKLGASAGRIRLVCATSADGSSSGASGPCRAAVDGERVDAARVRWVTPGRHQVELEGGGTLATRAVLVARGEEVTVTLEGARADDPDARGARVAQPEVARRDGLPPVFFWSGLGLTGAAVVAATYFTVDTANRHDDFVARPSVETSRAGESAQLRARVAWGAAGALAVATAALYVFTDFGPARVGVGPGALVVAGTFP